MKNIFFILILFFSTRAFSFTEIPVLSGPVIDKAGVLSEEEITKLESEIRQVYNLGKGPQINILIMSSLNGVTAEEFANKVFTSWHLGDRERDDGALFLVSVKDHKMRIEVGQGLEGSLTDAQSKEILISLRDDFKKNNFSSGVSKGLAQIIAVVTRPDAVQMPLSSTQVKTSRPEVDGFENLKAYAPDFLFFLSIMGLFIPLAKMYRSKNDLDRIKENIGKLNEKITELKKVKDIPNQTKELEISLEKLAEENDKLSEEVISLKDKQKTSPQGKFDELKDRKRKLEKTLNDLQTEVSRYQSIVNRGEV